MLHSFRLLTAGVLLAFAHCAAADLTYVYLTWQGDTSTTMTVNWQATKKPKSPTVYYDIQPHDRLEDYAHSIETESDQLDSRDDTRYVQHAELTGLTPGGTYYFQAGDRKNGYSDPMKFRTIPDTDEPIRFVTGGDMAATDLTIDLINVAAAQEPAFAAIGGDVAYANGNPRLVWKWDEWFTAWVENSTTPEGYTLPLVMGIGNHETFGMFDQSPERCPYYFGFFKQSPTSYFTRTFGKNFVMIVLDTSHAVHHKDQVEWLEQQFIEHRDVPFTFALYHVPLYSSVREISEYETRGRTYWLPLFDKYRLDTAFENHDHALKRTKLLRGGKEDPAGTLYLGDGCFGVEPRDLVNHPRPYMAHAQSVGHVWVVDVTKNGVTYRALGREGEELDRATTPAETE